MGGKVKNLPNLLTEGGGVKNCENLPTSSRDGSLEDFYIKLRNRSQGEFNNYGTHYL